jgi:hypothetical protein
MVRGSIALTVKVYGFKANSQNRKTRRRSLWCKPSMIYLTFDRGLTTPGTPSRRTSSVRTLQVYRNLGPLMMEPDYEEYPVSADIQQRCVSMIARLFNAPLKDESTNIMGTSTIGSSEVCTVPFDARQITDMYSRLSW